MECGDRHVEMLSDVVAGGLKRTVCYSTPYVILPTSFTSFASIWSW